MMKKKNYCTKCAVHHCAPTGKKCQRIVDLAAEGGQSEVGTDSHESDLHVHSQNGQKKAVITDHPSLALEVLH